MAEFKDGDFVVAAPGWAFGETHGYTKNAGRVFRAVENYGDCGELVEVRWQDGHESLHSPNELLHWEH